MFVVVFANYFIPYEKGLYKDAEASVFTIGFPAEEDTLIVSTVEEIEKAYEEGDEFAIQVDPDKIQKTNYYVALKGYDNGFTKSNGAFIHLSSVIEGCAYDRVYVVELSDGNRIPVQMYGRALDFSGDSILLPVGEKISYTQSLSMLEKIDSKYDLTADNATSWLVNASGADFYNSDEVSAKRQLVYKINWGIIIVGMFGYAIISTVVLAKKKKAARGN
jgi:hypothetical protein